MSCEPALPFMAFVLAIHSELLAQREPVSALSEHVEFTREERRLRNRWWLLRASIGCHPLRGTPYRPYRPRRTA